MNDLAPGLIVAAVTAVLVGGIFFWTARAKKKRIAALRSLCCQRGWKYDYETGPLYQKHAIAGAGWTFEASSRSSGRESAPGSSSWAHSTIWRSRQEYPGRETFFLGSRPSGGMDISRAPAWAIARLFGEEIAGLHGGDAGERLAKRYVLFEKEKTTTGKSISSKSEELLLAWPEKIALVVRSSPAELTLQVQGKRLEKVDEIIPFIELAESLLEH